MAHLLNVDLFSIAGPFLWEKACMMMMAMIFLQPSNVGYSHK